jgi:hypothetical protein
VVPQHVNLLLLLLLLLFLLLCGGQSSWGVTVS